MPRQTSRNDNRPRHPFNSNQHDVMSLPLSPHLEYSSRNLTANQVPITDLNSTRKLVIEVFLKAAQRKPQTHDIRSEEDQPPRIHRAYRAHIQLRQSRPLSALYSVLI